MADDNTAESVLDYCDSEEEDSTAPTKSTVNGGSSLSREKRGGTHVSIHSCGFRDFLLKPELLSTIKDCGFEHPSEVQQERLPQAVLSMDVLCQARSGMGKTAVFVLATLQQLEPVDGQVSVLVMAHTRELAFQISREYERFGRYFTNVKTAVFFGGMPVRNDQDVLKKACPHIVVGTPGRLLALVRSGALSVGSVRHFVLDECDKMLMDLDMRGDVQEIFRQTPHDKQVMMFSATLGQDIRPVCRMFMHDPLEVTVDDSKLTLHGLQQYYAKVKDTSKNRKLCDLLDALEFNQVIVFVKSVTRCVALTALLVENNFPAIAIHRHMTQEERLSCVYVVFTDCHATSSSRTFTSASWWPPTCLVVAWTSSVSTSSSTTTCPKTRTPISIEWHVPGGLAQRVWPSRLCPMQVTQKSSTACRNALRSA